jgi:hypothetical protein
MAWVNGRRINNSDTTHNSVASCEVQNKLYVLWTADDLSGHFTLAHQLTAKVGERHQNQQLREYRPPGKCLCISKQNIRVLERQWR